MPVTRLNYFQARRGKIEAVGNFLKELPAGIRKSPGCRSCRLLQDLDETARYVILEVWDSVEAHQASAQAIPPDLIGKLLPLLSDKPSGEYLRIQD